MPESAPNAHVDTQVICGDLHYSYEYGFCIDLTTVTERIRPRTIGEKFISCRAAGAEVRPPVEPPLDNYRRGQTRIASRFQVEVGCIYMKRHVT
jgi:hypothetical protein